MSATLALLTAVTALTAALVLRHLARTDAPLPLVVVREQPPRQGGGTDSARCRPADPTYPTADQEARP